MLRPDEKYKQAKLSAESGRAEKGDCDLAKLLSDIIDGKPIVDSPLSRAFSIYERSVQSKLLMESMLIAPDSTTEKIAVAMNAEVKMVEYYAEFFFDKTVFIDSFDIADYISTEEPKSKVTKTIGLTQGMHYVAKHFKGGELNLTSMQVYKKMQAGAYEMFIQGISGHSTSESAKESKAWAKVLKEITELVDKKEDDGNQGNFVEEFKVLFQHEPPVPSLGTIEGEVIRG